MKESFDDVFIGSLQAAGVSDYTCRRVNAERARRGRDEAWFRAASDKDLLGIDQFGAKCLREFRAVIPDPNPRKFTWDDVRACRNDLNEWIEDREKMLRDLADRIEALLPPRE